MTPRILFLADINSPHTQKWATSLSNDGFEIGVFSFNNSATNWYSNNKNIICLHKTTKKGSGRLFSKLKYLLLYPKLVICVLKFKPNVIHSHYASSYGLLGALTFFKPFIVSAWGSDVMEFPKKSVLRKFILKFVLFRANKICVTSNVLEKEISNYTKKPVYIIPFGINLNVFFAFKDVGKNNEFTFGCVKYLEKIYNIDKVILAFNLLVKKYPTANLKLKIVGNGSEKENLQKLIETHHLTLKVAMLGEVPHSQVPYHLNTLDVLVNVSEIESFGVSVAEAMACKIPVIVSNIEGFKDLIPNKNVGLITSSTSVESVFDAMENYFLNGELRNTAANNAYQHIKQKFNWFLNLSQMEKLYLEYMH
ncbi:MAG: glycosyltransferase [Bacteroidota bacterium]|nr:glycosyltransferase [Bacteroidota bacterium]